MIAATRHSKYIFGYIQQKNTKVPLTNGPNSDEEWSQIIIHQKVNGPTIGEEWSQHTCNYRQQSTDQPTIWLVTVDIDGWFGSTYGRTRSISTIGLVMPAENYAGNRTDFRDKKSSDFSGQIFRERDFCPRTAVSGKKCRSILIS